MLFNINFLQFNIFIIKLFVLIIKPGDIESCISTGICTGSACCGGTSCQLPTPCVQSTCQLGYTCGQYGCARNRARSSLTQKDGIIVPIDMFINSTILNKPTHNIYGVKRKRTQKPVPIATTIEKIDQLTYEKFTNPNYLFRQCCEDRNLPDSCLLKCHFNTYTKQSLQNMFFNNDPCPIEAAADLQYCAAQGRDHVACCIKNNVHLTLAGNKCLVFCDQRVNRITKLDYSFLPCYDRFEGMKRCFYNEIKQQMKNKLKNFFL